MITYRFLAGTSIEVLHEAFLNAFADYQVNMDMPLGKFGEMLRRRGYEENISMGAFAGETLVGFVLNGLRNWHGQTTAYDLGTGVLPEYRRQGLTNEMLKRVSARLKADSIGGYLLEVLTTNSSAVDLYAKQGFVTTRTLSCYRLERSRHIVRATWAIREVEPFDPERFAPFADFDPSWQNASDSINAVPEVFRYAAALDGDKVVGYGVIDPRSGDVPQMAVHPDYRRRGIGASLLDWLVQIAEAPKISVLNVDKDCRSMNVFLKAAGFEVFAEQYEMLRTDPQN